MICVRKVMRVVLGAIRYTITAIANITNNYLARGGIRADTVRHPVSIPCPLMNTSLAGLLLHIANGHLGQEDN